MGAGVTNCECKRICGMIGVRNFRQLEKHLNHFLNLNLGGFAVSGNSLFDFGGCIREYLAIGVGSCQLDNPLYFTHTKCAAHVFAEEDLLQHQELRLIPLH